MESKTDFVAVDNPSANDFIKHVTAAWAQYERVEISNRTKAALAAAKARGVKLGSNANRLSQINKERSENFVKRMQPIIKELRSQNITSVRKIAEELKRRRIRTFRGRYKRQKTSVHNLLLQLRKASS